MYVLDGGPRAGQLVDDLPDGYALDGSSRPSFARVLVADIPATTAVWTAPTRGDVQHLRRVD